MLATALLADRYLMGRRLGKDDTSGVFEGRDLLFARRVAVSIVDHPSLEDPAYLNRFQNEAWAAATLEHPGIARVYDVGQHRGKHYLVTEYVEGRSLAELLADEGPVPVREAARIVRTACHALAVAHGQGIVHGDVKPSNILVGHDGQVKVTGFGFTRTLQERGTDARSDLCSLGSCLSESLTGEDIPAELEAIVLKALAPDPSLRYQTAEELGAALDGLGLELEQGSPATPLTPRASPARWLLTVPLALCLTVAAAIFVPPHVWQRLPAALGPLPAIAQVIEPLLPGEAAKRAGAPIPAGPANRGGLKENVGAGDGSPTDAAGSQAVPGPTPTSQPPAAGPAPGADAALPPAAETVLPPAGEVVPPLPDAIPPPAGGVVPPVTDAVPPAGEVLPPAAETLPSPVGGVVPPPTGEVVPPVEEVVPPVEEVVPPVEEVVPPVEEVVPPVDEVVPPVEEVVPPVEEVVPPVEEVVPPLPDAVPPADQVVPPVEEVVPPVIEDVAPPLPDAVPPAAG